MHMNLVWVLDVESYFCSRLPRLSHCLIIPHMMGWMIIYRVVSYKANIVETPSYFVLPPKIVLDLMHLKKDHTDVSVYQKLFMEIRYRYSDYIPVYTDGSRDGNCVACATVFPSNTIISISLPDSASIFTPEIWAIIKAQEKINVLLHPNTLFLQTHLRVSKLYNLLSWNIPCLS